MPSVLGTTLSNRNIQVYSGTDVFLMNNWANGKMYNTSNKIFESGNCSFTVDTATNKITNNTTAPMCINVAITSSSLAVGQSITTNRCMVYTSVNSAGINTYGNTAAVGAVSFGAISQSVVVPAGQHIVATIYMASTANQTFTFNVCIEQIF